MKCQKGRHRTVRALGGFVNLGARHSIEQLAFFPRMCAPDRDGGVWHGRHSHGMAGSVNFWSFIFSVGVSLLALCVCGFIVVARHFFALLVDCRCPSPRCFFFQFVACLWSRHGCEGFFAAVRRDHGAIVWLSVAGWCLRDRGMLCTSINNVRQTTFCTADILSCSYGSGAI